MTEKRTITSAEAASLERSSRFVFNAAQSEGSDEYAAVVYFLLDALGVSVDNKEAT